MGKNVNLKNVKERVLLGLFALGVLTPVFIKSYDFYKSIQNGLEMQKEYASLPLILRDIKKKDKSIFNMPLFMTTGAPDAESCQETYCFFQSPDYNNLGFTVQVDLNDSSDFRKIKALKGRTFTMTQWVEKTALRYANFKKVEKQSNPSLNWQHINAQNIR